MAIGRGVRQMAICKHPNNTSSSTDLYQPIIQKSAVEEHDLEEKNGDQLPASVCDNST